MITTILSHYPVGLIEINSLSIEVLPLAFVTFPLDFLCQMWDLILP